MTPSTGTLIVLPALDIASAIRCAALPWTDTVTSGGILWRDTKKQPRVFVRQNGTITLHDNGKPTEVPVDHAIAWILAKGERAESAEADVPEVCGCDESRSLQTTATALLAHAVDLRDRLRAAQSLAAGISQALKDGNGTDVARHLADLQRTLAE